MQVMTFIKEQVYSQKVKNTSILEQVCADKCSLFAIGTVRLIFFFYLHLTALLSSAVVRRLFSDNCKTVQHVLNLALRSTLIYWSILIKDQ